MLMVDPGSDTNFICQEYAEALGLEGDPCSFKIKVVDQEVRAIQTCKFVFDVLDKDGDAHEVTALGLPSITCLPVEPDLGPIPTYAR